MLARVCNLYDDIGSATLDRNLGDQVGRNYHIYVRVFIIV